MQVPFTDPVSASLLFLQSLFLYLHYATPGFWAEDHWGVYFLPTFIGLIFLVAMLASEALFDGRRRVVQGINEISQTTMSHVLFQMLTGVMLLFTLVLYVFFLDEDTDLPFYWISTSFFVTSMLFSITLILIYQSKCNHHAQASKILVFVAILALAQGLFIWLYDSQWGRVMNVQPWIIALPTFLFLLASFYRTLMQTYQKRNDSGPQMVRQFSFLFLILMVSYVILTVDIYMANPDIGWVQPQWIILPFMVYSAILVLSAIYVYWATKGISAEKKTDVPYSQPDKTYDQKHAYTPVSVEIEQQKDAGFLPGYNPTTLWK